jgi:catechol 2,3-dioxygenase-like lactoylglutathione lyase family enzyme
MFTHVMVGTNEPTKAMAFYDATFGELGVPSAFRAEDRAFYSTGEGGMFGVVPPRDGNAATFANGGTIGFAAKSPEMVDAWYAAGLANGGTDEGAPGRRDFGRPMYGAYLRDPTGNKICAFVVLSEGD